MTKSRQDKQNEKKQSKIKQDIQLDIKTWSNDSKGTFNYKDNCSNHKRFKNYSSCFIFRKNINCIEMEESQILDDNENCDLLFRIRKSSKVDNKYEIINPIQKNMRRNEYNINQLNNALWYVINYGENKNDSYTLNENDILKIGRKKYEVIKLNIHNENNYQNNDNNLEYNISKINAKKGNIFNLDIENYQYCITNDDNDNTRNNTEESVKENEKIDLENNKKNININIINNFNNKNKKNKNKNNGNNDNINSIDEIDENERCRICFNGESTKENPKLHLCSCKDYIHLECLKKYINTKTEILDNSDFSVQAYVCQKFNCEVCLTPYPLRFRIKEYNKIYNLIDFNMPQELDYLVLESLDYVKNHNNLKIIHVVQLIKDTINIGRRFTNDIIDKDISVSRDHAVLKYNKEKGIITVENRSEKFGTLALIKGNIPITEQKIDFQVGNNYVTACKTDQYIDETFVKESFTTKNNIDNIETQVNTIQNNLNIDQ